MADGLELMRDLEGKTAVVTGAASGIGLGLIRACAARGMKVVMSDVDEPRLAGVAATLADAGATVITSPADVRSRADVEAIRDTALSAFGAVHLVANNAGVGFAKPLLESESSDWDLVLDINLRGVVNGLDVFLPLLLDQQQGHVSATSSLSGLVADPGLSVYNASKFAVAGIMESIGLELAEQGSAVTASVLCPGPVATKLAETSAAATGTSWDDEVADYLARGMAPNEVGEMALSHIEQGRFWLLSHPDMTFELLDGRVQAMKDGGRLFIPDTAWTDT